MFALLFDRKSLTMTLLALGCMGLLLFVSGFALGSYLNGGLEHLGVIARQSDSTSSRVASGATPAASTRSTRRSPSRAVAAPEVIEVDDPAPLAPEETDGASTPPADWVPPFDGAPWPGEEAGPQETAEETLTAEMEIAEMPAADMPEPQRTDAETIAETATPEMAAPEIRTASLKSEKAALPRASGFYYVQLGTFSREELALEKRDEVKSFFAKGESGEPFLVPVIDRSGRTAYAVRVGPFPTRSAAREAAAGQGRASVVWAPSGRTL